MSQVIMGPRPWPLWRHPAFRTAPREWAVVSCFFNPAGYRRPVLNLGAFLDWSYAERLPLYMAELTFHDARPVLPPDSARVIHFQAGNEGIMFQKEALLNAVVRALPAEVRFIVFMDADVVLEQGRAALEMTAHQLECGWTVVQPFHEAVWLDAAGRDGAAKMSTAAAYLVPRADLALVTDTTLYHPGFAYGMTRETWEQIGGLYGCPITGSGDAALLQAMVGPYLPDPGQGKSHHSAPAPRRWRAAVEAVAKKTGGGFPVTHVNGRIRHFYHGSMQRREYGSRHRLLAAFRPERDLELGPGGLPIWSGKENPGLRAAVAVYFSERREDD